MAEGGNRARRVRMPKVSFPGRSRGASEKKTSPVEAQPKQSANPAGAKAPSGATKEKAPEPNIQERMEGLQGWMAEIERKQGRMTYFGIAGVAIAILAAGAALYFGLTAKSDSATKGDLDALTKRIDALEAAATKNSKDTQEALNSSVSQLQQSIAAVQKQQAQNAASISTLQSQASAAALNKGTGTGNAAAPGATTTTTTTGK